MKLLRAIAPAAAAFALSTSAFAQAQVACAAIDEQQIAALFDRWNSSLATLNPDKVAANYAPDAVLLPTVSNQARTNTAAIRDYFVKFLKGSPQGKIDARTIKVGCNVAQDVGTYTFAFKGGNVVHARYTYVYEWRDGTWLISHHHSSSMPEPATTK